ncbi:Ribonuclease HI [Trichostrongylus colubriformis]|uniref:Ribonuclease HI n=1 Tax=Trichostrongylus colubriformis TaxID=6319 RepID=A0AAN8IDD4_TRICO
MPTDADIPEDRSAPTQQTEDQEDMADTVIRLDPRDLHTIIQGVKADATSTSQSPSATHSFKREGFGRVTYYPRATQETSVAVSKKRRIEEDPPAICAEEKDTGPRNAQKVDKLLSTGAIQETGCDSHSLLHIHPLSVAKGRKLRLVLDLSHLNKFLHVPKIKLDDICSILNVLPDHGFMATFDLKAGYHHVRIKDSDTNYLGFRWEGRCFKFLCLPFGLSSAPYIFTKLLRSFIKVWRAQGRGVAIYIDDGIIFERSKEACQDTISIIRADLSRTGWFFADNKCKWSPSHSCKWLGFHIDLSSMVISLSLDRLTKAIQRLRVMTQRMKPSLYDRLRWAGTLSSMHVVPDYVDKRFTRAVAREIAAAQVKEWLLSKTWDKTAEEQIELQYWEQKLRSSPQACLKPVVDNIITPHILDVDASNHSVGAILRNSVGVIISRTFRELPEHLLQESSTARELFAIYFALDAYKDSISRVLVNTDSLSSVAMYKKGSLALHLHQMAQRIWDLEQNHNIHISMKWIPRGGNCEADLASRLIDYDDWRIADHIFRALINKWGQPNYDMFANDRNTRCDIFFSRYQCPGSSGVDAFAQVEPWQRGLLWLVPPINMISKTLKWAYMHKSRGILGCPLWKSQPFYPCIKSGYLQGIHFIKDSVIFPVGTKLFKEPQIPGAFGSEFSQSPFIFILMDFAQRSQD